MATTGHRSVSVHTGNDQSARAIRQNQYVNCAGQRSGESARRLRNYTAPMPTRFLDPWDVVYLGRTISNYLEYVAEERELAVMLLDLVGQTMRVLRGGKLMQAAHAIDGTATRLVNATEVAAGYVAAQQAHRAALAVELFRVRPEAFGGIICTWYRSGRGTPAEAAAAAAADAQRSASGADDTPEIVEEGGKRRTFQCNSGTTADAAMAAVQGHIDAVVQVPANVFRGQKMGGTGPEHQQQPQSAPVQQLLVSVFKDSTLFPRPERTMGDFDVLSCVIGVKVSFC